MAEEEIDFSDLARKLSSLFALTAVNGSLLPEQRELMAQSIAVMTNIDPFFVAKAGYEDTELVAMFKRASETHNETEKQFTSMVEHSFANLTNFSFASTERQKLKYKAACDTLDRLGHSVIERAKFNR